MTNTACLNLKANLLPPLVLHHHHRRHHHHHRAGSGLTVECCRTCTPHKLSCQTSCLNCHSPSHRVLEQRKRRKLLFIQIPMYTEILQDIFLCMLSSYLNTNRVLVTKTFLNMENIHIGVFKTLTTHAVPSVSGVFPPTLQQAVTDPGAVCIYQFSMKLLFFLFLKHKHTDKWPRVSSDFLFVHVHSCSYSDMSIKNISKTDHK